MSRRPSKRGGRGGLLFAAPWLTGFVILYFIPMLFAAYVSFTAWDGLNAGSLKWTGARNYTALVDDRYFATALINSALYTALNVPFQTAAALGLALLVRNARRARSLWATAYYLPHVLGGVASILIWWWLLNPRIGPVNHLIHAGLDAVNGCLQAIGFSGTGRIAAPPWLFSPTWARPSLVLMNLWQAGGTMLILLAALLRGGDAAHEAARLDGAGRWRRFRHITLPQISPALFFTMLTGIVFSMQAFGQAYLLQNWQQQDSLLFYVVQMYRTAFEFHRFGAAAAMAWVLLGLLVLSAAAAFRIARNRVHFDFEEGIL